MLLNIIKNIGKDSLIYGFGHVLGRGIDFLIIPILTRMFTPSDFGLIELVHSTITFCSIIAVMGTNTAFYFFYHKKPFDGDAQAQRNLFNGVMLWNILSGFVIFACVILLLYITQSSYMTDLGIMGLVAIACYGLLKILDQRFLELFRILRRPFLFLTTRVFTSLVIAGAVLMLNNSDDQTVLRYFQYLLGSLFCVLILDLFLSKKTISFSSFEIGKGYRQLALLLKFGVGVFPGAIAMIIHNLSDRWMLEYWGFRYDLGLYAIAAKFGALMALAVSIFTLAFQPISIKLIHDDDTAQTGRIFDVLLRYYLLIFGGGFLILSMISPFILGVIAPDTFATAIKAVPVLVFSAVMFGVTYFTSLGTWKMEKTLRFSSALILSSILNIALNIWLIPKIGMMGAAFATSVSMTFLVLFSFMLSQITYKLSYSTIRIVFLVIIQLITAMALSIHYQQSDAQMPWGIMGLSLLLMVCFTIKKKEYKDAIIFVKGSRNFDS